MDPFDRTFAIVEKAKGPLSTLETPTSVTVLFFTASKGAYEGWLELRTNNQDSTYRKGVHAEMWRSSIPGIKQMTDAVVELSALVLLIARNAVEFVVGLQEINESSSNRTLEETKTPEPIKWLANLWGGCRSEIEWSLAYQDWAKNGLHGFVDGVKNSFSARFNMAMILRHLSYILMGISSDEVKRKAKYGIASNAYYIAQHGKSILENILSALQEQFGSIFGGLEVKQVVSIVDKANADSASLPS